MSSHFNEHAFIGKVDRSLAAVRKVISNNKNPVLASTVSHVWDDKFLLANFLTCSFIAANLTCLTALGFTREQLEEMRKWAATRSVTLRFVSTESCDFLRKETKEVDSKSKNVTEVLGMSITSKVVTTVVEYFWDFKVKYELTAYVGTGQNAGESMVIRQRSASHEIKTSSESTPHPLQRIVPASEVNISWLLTKFNSEGLPLFEINRANEKCFTPRRNPDIKEAYEYCCYRLSGFCRDVANYFTTSNLFRAHSDNALHMNAMHDVADVFVPVLPLLMEVKPSALPLLEDGGGSSAAGGGGSSGGSGNGNDKRLVEAADLNVFLGEQRRSLQVKMATMGTLFPAPSTGRLISSAEGEFAVVLQHFQMVCSGFRDGIDFIEDMIRKQLIAAIGREVTPSDLCEYMRFHNKKILLPQFVPVPFCYAVRRSSEHSPEGIVSIEEINENYSSANSSIPAPIFTIASKRVVANSRETNMEFSLDASTRISFGGERHLHAWLQHTFSASAGAKLRLVNEARQFSSFIVLIGRISSARTFDPKRAMIVKDKDCIRIPLNLEQIPSAKEFKDAIKSLSPEQQRFAQAFRSMQLESTMFGVCVIQIKPQLEKVLKLTPDSLTKEIKLNQELMELFIEYQIPSDLLCFGGDETADSIERLTAVKAHVAAMQSMIQAAKSEEVLKAKLQHQYDHPPLPPSLESCVPAAMPMPMAMMSRSSAPSMPMMKSRSVALAPSSSSSPPPPPPPGQSGGGGVAPRSSSSSSTSKSSASSSSSSSNNNNNASTSSSEIVVDDSSTVGFVDYPKLPSIIDEKFETLGKGDVVRPTIIHPHSSWEKKSQKSLLAKPIETVVDEEAMTAEKKKAFDLLDALTKSGALTVDNASLHVVMVYTHCFDKSIIDTIVRDNINPIEKVEKSTLIMASVVHDQPVVRAMLKDSHADRVLDFSPTLR